MRRLADDADTPGCPPHEARGRALTVAAAAAVTPAVRLPLGEVARHRLLPPAAAARVRRGRAVARLSAVVLREGEVKWQGEGDAGLLLHQRRYLVGGEDGNPLEVKAAERRGLGRRVEGVRVVGVAVRVG